jgi:hypothetical protein
MLDKTSTAQLAAAAPLYFVECDGKINGRKENWFVERDCADMNLLSTARDILDGQIEHVSKVWCAEDGKFTDETEVVATKMADLIADGADMPKGDAFDFMECALGCRYMADLTRDLASA